MIRLGPFELLAPLASGGMGQVWRGRHAGGVPAAIKVLGGEVNDQTRRAFEHEAQAHAGLSHPAIVYLFDYGTVGAAAAAASDGRLAAGTPYLAMELAEAGTLRSHLPMADWTSVYQVVTAVLDALAHAHARDVIHRDIKPENILLFAGAGAQLVPKLSDFGIAHALGKEHDAPDEALSRFWGTPFYVAPEQARSQWREYGPWTDLYALGCVVWELVCGATAHRADTPAKVLLRHVIGVRPAFTPWMRVPAGLEGWLDRMLARDPRVRFQRAADAPPPPAVVGPPQPTEARLGPAPRAPFPPSPRTSADAALPTPLVGAGLGLFGLREVPFVDRDAARQTLWRTLAEVVDTGQLRVVLLVGGPGTGKSSLAQWMATRADEAGAVTRLVATHARSGGAELEGMAGMWRRAFRAFGLSRGELYEHLVARLEDDDDEASNWRQRARALTEWLQPTPDDATAVDGPRHSFSSERERYELARRLLVRLSAERPALIWLDDLQWGRQTLSVLEHLLDSRDQRPQALVVATVRADAVAEDAALAERIAAVEARPGCRSIELAALEPADHRELLARMLRLEPALLDQLAERTEGNPLFATQLLRDLIDREQLEATAAGFRLREDAAGTVPEGIVELWTGRIDRLVESFAPEAQQPARHAVELAAVLGRQVSVSEWRAACADADVGAPEALAGQLVARGLAHRTDDGFAFAHGLLVDSLAEQARQAGRWRRWHRHCAQMLAQHGAPAITAASLRRGRHRAAAGEHDRAADLLLDALEQGYTQSEYDAATEAYAALERSLDALGATPHDPRRVQGMLKMTSVHIVTGRLDDAERLVARAEAAIAPTDEPDLQAWLQVRQSDLMHMRGHVRTSIPLIEQARALALDDDDLQIVCLRYLAYKYMVIGEMAQARDASERGIALEQAHGRPTGRTRRVYASVLQYQGQPDDARQQLALARREFEPAHDLHELGLTYNALGELAREEGRLDEAESLYRQAYAIFDELGGADQPAMGFNLGMVELERGDPRRAHDHFARARRDSEASGYRYLEFFGTWGELTRCAVLGDWAAADACLAALTGPLADVEQVEPDIALLATRAAELAGAADDPARARRLAELAARQWRALGDDARAAQVEADAPPGAGSEP